MGHIFLENLKFCPGDLVGISRLPPGPLSLFGHACHLDVMFFLYLCSYLVLDQSAFFPYHEPDCSTGFGKQPRPALPTATEPTRVLCLSRASALGTASCACRFLPVFTRISATASFLSLYFWYMKTSQERVILNFSVSSLKGRCGLV